MININCKVLLTAALLTSFVISGCGEEAAPSRDHIPVLKKRLYELQVAVASKDRAAIDSLLSVDILSNEQSSDSLLSFVYGAGHDFGFVQFGRYEILYTDNNARINCFVMDSLSDTTRPVTFSFVNQHEMWLLSQFEARDIDSSNNLE